MDLKFGWHITVHPKADAFGRFRDVGRVVPRDL